MKRAKTIVPWVAGWVLLISVPSLADVETAERALRLEGELDAAGVVAVENLLGSIDVRGGGQEGRFRVEARVEAQADTAEAAGRLADQVRLDLRHDAGWPLVHVAVPLDDFTAFCSPRTGGEKRDQGKARAKAKARATAAVEWVSSLLRIGGETVTYENRQVRIERLKGAASLAVHLTVTLPSGVRASFDQAAGPIQVARIPGSIRARVQYGDILAEQIYGRVEASADSGEIRLRSLKGQEVLANTDKGALNLADVDVAKLELQLGEGTIQARSVRGETVTASAEKGPIVFDGLEGTQIRLSTGEGDLDVITSLDRTRQAALSSGSGDVTLRLGGVTPFRLEAQLAKGSVRSKLRKASLDASSGERSVVTRGAGGAEISVRLGRGNVSILPR